MKFTTYVMNPTWLKQFYIIIHLEIDFFLIIYYLFYLIFSINLCNQFLLSIFWIKLCN